MTAIGLLLMATGMLFVLLIDDERSFSAAVARWSAGIGSALMLAGLAAWLWMVAP